MSPKNSIAALGVFGIAALLVTAGVFAAAPGVFRMSTGPSTQQAHADTSLTVVDAGCESTLTQESSFTNSETFEKTGILYTDSETRNLLTETTRTDREDMTAFNVTVSAADANTSQIPMPRAEATNAGVSYTISASMSHLSITLPSQLSRTVPSPGVVCGPKTSLRIASPKCLRTIRTGSPPV